MTDLLQESRRRTRRLVLACGGVTLAGIVWAVWPMGTPRIDAPTLQVANAAPAEVPLPPLDVKAFSTPVWTIAAAPPSPAPPPSPPPPPPPLKLQLIGIIKEEAIYKAVLYDPDTNKLWVVASGQNAAGHKIDRVAPDAITIKDGPLVRMLALKSGGGTSGLPGGGP